jgi:hypothetical protein
MAHVRVCGSLGGAIPQGHPASDFGGKNREITLEQVAEATNALAWTTWKCTWRSPDEIAERCVYYHARNRASYENRKRKARLRAGAERDK